MSRDALSETPVTALSGLSLTRRLKTATVLGFGAAGLLAFDAPVLAADRADTQSAPAEAAADAQTPQADRADRLANEKAAKLLKAIVADDAWTALDSIAVLDPVAASGEVDATVNTVAADEFDFPGMPVHVAAVPHTETPELSPAAEAVAASPVSDRSDETQALDAAIATVIETSTVDAAQAPRPDVRDTMQADGPAAENRAAGDLTALISKDDLSDFAGFLRMLQVAMVDIASSDANDQEDPAAAAFNGLFVDRDGFIVTVLDDALSAQNFRVTTADGRTLDASLVSLDQDRDLGLLKVAGEGPFEYVALNDDAKTIISEMRAEADRPRGYLGVSIQSVPLDVVEEAGLDGPKGVLISTVRSDTAAASADLRPGDIIMEVNGAEIQHTDDAVRSIGMLPVGSDVTMAVWRDGDIIAVSTTLTPWPQEETLYPEPVITDGIMEDISIDGWGVTVGAGVEPGVEVVAVSPDSEAADKGLKTGDVILRIAETTITEAGDVALAIEQAKAMQRPAVLLRVRGPVRGSEERFIALKLEGDR
ncbi:MAG: PDZ domain-containing protein [Alphaproteobacteria bacterium]